MQQETGWIFPDDIDTYSSDNLWLIVHISFIDKFSTTGFQQHDFILLNISAIDQVPF